MKRVLVPTDFSQPAGYALRVAASIVRRSEGRLFLMHVMDIPEPDSENNIDPKWQLLLNQTEKKFKEIFAEDFMSDINTAEIIGYENILENITRFSEENEIELIVMGSYGASGIREKLMGSNAQKVVRNVDVPVLIVKNEISDFNPADMVFASDFGQESYDSFLDVMGMVHHFNARLHLLKVITRSAFENNYVTTALMQNFIQYFKLRNVTKNVFNDESVVDGILNFSDSIQADLIALCTEGRSPMYQIFNESVAEKLVNLSERPILTVKRKF